MYRMGSRRFERERSNLEGLRSGDAKKCRGEEEVYLYQWDRRRAHVSGEAQGVKGEKNSERCPRWER